ncbi:MAG: hypothetical protein SF187_07895 [Deltaproteobacteria bacterium]|nr:hypothetical protein [Deltaproteobacteria bacterium]
MALGGEIDARLPLYTYLRPVIEGRRVLELGGRTRPGAETLVKLGAASVVALVDDGAITGPTGGNVRCLPSRTPLDALISAGPFDVVLLPDAASILAPKGRLTLANVSRLLSPEGTLVLAAASADQRGASGAGFTYYDLQEQLAAVFPVVRMFGQTPFAALSIAEFDADVSDLRVDADLIDPEAEEPTRYIALASHTPGPALGYALVQVPAMAVSAPVEPPRADPAAAEIARQLSAAQAQVAAISTKLLDAQGQSEGAARVARAQAEEIEELRGRVRRAAETRVQLDEEVARLRKALAEADESVLNLTRRTADEMSALAARLSSTIAAPAAVAAEPRTGSWRDVAVLTEKLKQREAQLAQRESALFDRDERIAGLETEKQDLAWQLQSALAGAGSGTTVVVAPETKASPGERERELEALLATRDRALEEFRHAAAVHIHEVERLRSAVSEQTAHVNELEEALADAETRAAEAVKEAERARIALAQSQDADRARRARLSELEGTLLRMRHEANNRPRNDDAELTLARRQVAELEARLAMMDASLREAERGRHDATTRWNEAVERLMGLEQQSVVEREVVKQAQENVEQVARVAGEDVNRLRAALDRSEDQLRKARGQLLPLRGRVAMLEREKEARDVAERDLVRTLLEEVGALETGLREEFARIDDLAREVMQVRGVSVTVGLGNERAPE